MHDKVIVPTAAAGHRCSRKFTTSVVEIDKVLSKVCCTPHEMVVIKFWKEFVWECYLFAGEDISPTLPPSRTTIRHTI